jgi:hypothetical protein
MRSSRIDCTYDHKTNDCIVMILIWMVLGHSAIKGRQLVAYIFLCDSHIFLTYYFSREHDLFETT